MFWPKKVYAYVCGFYSRVALHGDDSTWGCNYPYCRYKLCKLYFQFYSHNYMLIYVHVVSALSINGFSNHLHSFCCPPYFNLYLHAAGASQCLNESTNYGYSIGEPCIFIRVMRVHTCTCTCTVNWLNFVVKYFCMLSNI